MDRPIITLADPGGGAPFFPHFFPRSLGSRFILSQILIEIWPNHANN